jgi:hypothetical protein
VVQGESASAGSNLDISIKTEVQILNGLTTSVNSDMSQTTPQKQKKGQLL